MKDIKVIGFDADDTLWVNEPYFQEVEQKLCDLLIDFGETESIKQELYKTELQNLKLYGFGIKGFMLSMIETALCVSKHKLKPETIEEILLLGKNMIDKPVEMLGGVVEVLDALYKTEYRLIIATKGDLLDQERKLAKSDIEKYFHHIEVMSDKKEENYLKLLKHLDISPDNFLMIGDSIKSDILPVLNIGGNAIHIPFHTTWVHEQTENNGQLDNYWEIKNIKEITTLLDI